MEVIAHQTIRVKTKRKAVLGLPKGVQKRLIVFCRQEEVSPIVSAIERVLNKAVRHRSLLATVDARLDPPALRGKRKNALPRVFDTCFLSLVFAGEQEEPLLGVTVL